MATQQLTPTAVLPVVVTPTPVPMLKKVIKIKNVGRFLNFDASGDVELRRFNLLFGENGRGKTTLCAIFRSLSTNTPALVIGRATLGTIEPPEIQLLTG